MMAVMSVRQDPLVDATRRAERQVRAVLEDARAARMSRGLSMVDVATAMGCSRQLIGLIEAGGVEDPGAVELVRYCAAVGLDLPLRTFPGGARLRDVGQIRLLTRFFGAMGDEWAIRTEVPVSQDPRDGRAVDAILSRTCGRIGVEAITRLTDGQAQSRPALLKQAALGLHAMVIAVSDTRHNRAALAEGGAPFRASFPIASRAVLRALRRGELPPGNGIVLL
jgi:transcriptional regulator with XRE-family HTH domain